MSDRLFPFLLALTLLDLAFVHATGVVTGASLVPLWLLTAASPWLRRLQRTAGCRAIWNAVVLLVFALLVHHATTTGLLYMLEDGLLLAVLCQVHLLNNVGDRQRPDLVFFNSFLVAFVTSFFAPDLGWSLLFIAHAFVFVPALQTNVLGRHGPPPRGTMPVILRESIRRTVVIGALTAAVFVLLPRDFGRPGWLGDAMVTPEQLQTGLAEQIRLGDEFAVRLRDDVVMRLEPESGDVGDVPTHWRAIAFSTFDGMTWLPLDVGRPGPRSATDGPWEGGRDGVWRHDARGDAGTVRVRLHDRGIRCLPCPLTTRELRIESDDVLPDPRPYGVLGVLPTAAARAAALDYTVGLGTAVAPIHTSARVRSQLSALPNGAVPPIVNDVAARLREQSDPDAGDEAIAERVCQWLRDHRRYALPGEPGFARNLGEFLIGSGTGHCEYFATALALLLRVQGIPCRLAGGYLAHEIDADAKTVVVRARHAHAWVEMLRADGTWITLDATPPASVMAPPATSWWHAVTEQLTGMWSRVVSFDGQRRTEWLRALANLPADHPFVTMLVLVPAALLVYRRVRRRQTVPVIVDLERAVRAAGLSWQSGETPRELLGRAATAGVRPEHLTLLDAAARRHEAQRYGRAGGDGGDAPR